MTVVKLLLPVTTVNSDCGEAVTTVNCDCGEAIITYGYRK